MLCLGTFEWGWWWGGQWQLSPWQWQLSSWQLQWWWCDIPPSQLWFLWQCGLGAVGSATPLLAFVLFFGIAKTGGLWTC